MSLSTSQGEMRFSSTRTLPQRYGVISWLPRRIARTVARATVSARDGLVLRPFRAAFALDDLVEELGVGRAGADHQHVDAGRGELGPDRLAESMHGELAGRVFAIVRHAAATEDRTDIDDDRPPALFEQGQGGAGHFDQGEEVDLHEPPHPLGIGRLEGTDGADARVVDENVEAAEMRLGRFDAPLSGSRIGNIAGNARDTAAQRFDFLGQRLQAIFPPGHADDFAALPGQFQRNRPADAAGGAGHDRSASLDCASGHGRSLCRKGL